MRISENFSLSEFTTSRNYPNIKNVPNAEQCDNLQRLVTFVLQPVRNIVKKSISISSGFRCPELNKAVGGSATSDHMRGRSSDIFVTDGSMTPRQLAQIIIDNVSFDQCIIYKTFVHVSYRSESDNRNMIIYK